MSESTPAGLTLVSPPAPQVKLLQARTDWSGPAMLAQQLGLQMTESDYGPQFAASPGLQQTLPDAFACALPDYAVLTIAGADSQTFLQGQLTNDVAALSPGAVQLTGYCTPKGRLLASGWLYCRAPHDYLWLVSSGLAPALRKRLSMYVMRSKVTVTDGSADWAVFGQTSTDGFAVLKGDAIALPIERLPSSARLLLVPLADAVTSWQEICTQTPQIESSAAWRLLEIRSGIARVTARTSELFVPQMVNFELVGGVNFKKGCYPGQEIVARSQYLGKLKRRMLLARADRDSKVAEFAPPPGADVWATDAAGLRRSEPVGQVVMAAATVSGFECLIESAELDSLTSLFVADSDGQMIGLERMQLPYAIEKIA